MSASQFFDAAQAALSCVCEAMDDLVGQEGVPEDYACPCLASVSAGEPVIDCCIEGDCEEQGMLTVHIENVFPSDNFPAPYGGYEPCKAGTWVATLVVTAARCSPSIDSQGNPASPEELTANALLMALDQYAIMFGLSCCLVNDPPAGKRKRRVFITESTPLVSEGGCASVEVRVLVEAGTICCTEPVS